eukprot:CAMPEP_0114528104 /NCGR_PEP_ID=MMETSP0109-20121206/24008_1 /TAXON_ID=29199 /ORGANISM="Chlorarachnion reptans, Strain CCCM449" /LENGTH=327 /DNA_ID=CAMNT_0001710187 /DNA_START=185 /DNA_END=1168 /DNA_ORIENTATION=+
MIGAAILVNLCVSDLESNVNHNSPRLHWKSGPLLRLQFSNDDDRPGCPPWPTVISNVKHPVFQKLRAAQGRWLRGKEECFIAEGDDQIKSALEAQFPLTHVVTFGMDSFHKLRKKCPNRTEMALLSTGLVNKLYPSGKRPESVALAVVPPLELKRINHSSGIMLVLENIQDPGNLGTMLRSAEAFGTESVVCTFPKLPNGTSSAKRLFSRVAIRASMGSIFRLRLAICNDIQDVLHYCKKHAIPVIASTPCSRSAYLSVNELIREGGINQNRILLAVGNEGRGLSAKALQAASANISIPTASTVESLNVAVACGVLLHEFRKHSSAL